MAQPLSQNKLSETAKKLFWGGLVIVIVSLAVNYMPSAAPKWAANPPGSSIFFWLQIILFIVSIAALITVFSLAPKVLKYVKIKQIKIKGVEFNFEVNPEEDE